MTPLELWLQTNTPKQIPEGQRSATEKDIHKALRGETDSCIPHCDKSPEQRIKEIYGNSLTDTQFLQAVEQMKIEEN